MDLLELMDAVAVHAKAAAITAGGATLSDVAVGYPAGKGRCVRIFYGGEREPERFTMDESLASLLVSQAIVVRGYWPTASTSTKEQRIIEGQMGTFVKSFRTRLLTDQDLGGKAADGLKMHTAQAGQVVIGTTQYAIVDIEIVVDYDEFTQTR